MKRFITFGSIAQFRNIVTSIKHQSRFTGIDPDSGTPVYNRDPLPKLIGTASEKIHGTNAAICFSNPDGFWIQSRKNIITSEKDNAGCAFAVLQTEPEWMDIILGLSTEYNIDLDKYIISVFFEWAGGSIQKNSALTGVDKKALIFQHFKVSPLDTPLEDDGNKESAIWLETCIQGRWVDHPAYNINNIMNFTTWDIDIDFDNPAKSQNMMIKLVEEVIEPSSPVGKQFSQKGNIGEGIVVTVEYKDSLHKFKVKGDKHSSSKVKKLKPVDEAKENAKREFANYACPAWRLEQMWKELEDEHGKPVVIQMTGEFLSMVHRDVIKEESDVLAEKGLEPKEVNGMISQVARTWFNAELDKESGL